LGRIVAWYRRRLRITNNEFTFGSGSILGDAAISIDGISGSGGLLTFSAGYDHEVLGSLVVGTFVDYDVADIDSKIGISDPLFGSNANINFKITDQLSVGARLGYLVSWTTLFYTSFGYAHVQTSDLNASATTPFGSAGGTIASVGGFDGYFIGGGVETLISNGFSIKAEYRYTSLEAENATFAPSTGLNGLVTASIRPQLQTARVSLNYRFGDGKSEKVDNSIPPVTSSWTAPYMGVGTGYSVASNDVTLAGKTALPAAINIDGMGSDGGFISFTLGYDYQLSHKFVVGAFADADYSNMHHNNGISISSFGSTLNVGTKAEYDNILMLGGRLGYLVTPDTLLFASGGYANAGLGDTRLDAAITIPGFGSTSASGVLIDGKRFSGGFVGGGVETRINDALSLKAEYRYIDLGSEDMTLLPGTPVINSVLETKFDPAIQMGRISINWRIGAGGDSAAASGKE
jgi:outer membrane immunogenic protein